MGTSINIIAVIVPQTIYVQSMSILGRRIRRLFQHTEYRSLFIWKSARTIRESQFRTIPSHVARLFLPTIATWYQQDGATCHTSNFKIKFISNRKRDFKIENESRESHIAPQWHCMVALKSRPNNNFFLWGYLKSWVCCNDPTTIAQLMTTIRQ